MPELDRLTQAVEGFITSLHLDPAVGNALQLAVEELFTNAVSYGYEAGAVGNLELSLDLREGWLLLKFSDDARAFNPLQDGPPVNTEAALEERGIGGLGIHLTRKLFDEVSYQRVDGRNLIRLRKKLSE
jgi:serine/threonine-protein kinase RsbW